MARSIDIDTPPDQGQASRAGGDDASGSVLTAAAPAGSAPTAQAQPTRHRRRLTEGGAPVLGPVFAAALAAVLGAGIGTGVTLGATGALDGDGPGTVAAGAVARTNGGLSGAAADPAAVSDADWSAIAAKASPAVVAIEVQSAQGGGQGSGVVWNAEGDIVTNNHVVAAAGAGGTVQVRLGAQATYAAKVVGTDPTTDLAVVRLTDPPKDLHAIGRAEAGSLSVGDPVMALGNPLGLSGTVTTGIVSALNRPVATQAVTGDGAQAQPGAFAPTGGQEVVTDAIQTSAAINPGNSGGALVDASGDLVGINSSIASLSSAGGQGGQAGNIGIGFAIPIAEVQTVVGQLLDGGTVTHATLGVSIADAQVSRGAATIAGAGVREVRPGSAAAQAGLKAGDVVTAVDGRPIDGADGLVGAVRGMAVGSAVKLTVTGAQGAERTVSATLEAKA